MIQTCGSADYLEDVLTISNIGNGVGCPMQTIGVQENEVVEEADPCPDRFIEGFLPYKFSIIFNNGTKILVFPFHLFSHSLRLSAPREPRFAPLCSCLT